MDPAGELLNGSITELNKVVNLIDQLVVPRDQEIFKNLSEEISYFVKQSHKFLKDANSYVKNIDGLDPSIAKIVESLYHNQKKGFFKRINSKEQFKGNLLIMKKSLVQVCDVLSKFEKSSELKQAA